MLERWKIREIVKLALSEDLPFGDITSEILIPPELYGRAFFIAKENLVICGKPVVEEVFNVIDPDIKITWQVEEGTEVEAQTKLGFVEGNIKNILKGERVALNFFQHLCGIATYTRQIVQKLTPYCTILLDTRKTLPGLKILQKYAVKIGGGKNHRFSLSDGILIKDNHIKALGGIKEVIKKLNNLPHYLKVEIEVKSLEELRTILNSQAPIDIILLDNFPPDKLKEAIKMIKSVKPNIKIEASGGIKFENIEEVAKTGIDYISSGTLTHSVKAVDISLKIETIYNY
ncbi:MAG: nicotinate-nucleotide diphosphorylase (carboxylating) [Thermodesulfobacterium geofontis]|uniref:Probable nicotinate-nucleotide pyrophosphorylase [carboxylating] n=1 Tax=Thermodesulfobacterium geofontis TaxID=1295609 RepID=A0A2N7PNI3_9BACT|nr:MAG: nicotinate-nucleotide diphosphorylase (carboxylating) [Thermodesulfobacterium geofontis]PMP93758.1 MAG: nicotinate-nucleotide diphosphorylase (carboxylating) [Thermodesulfobacterium geofontis]